MKVNDSINTGPGPSTRVWMSSNCLHHGKQGPIGVEPKGKGPCHSLVACEQWDTYGTLGSESASALLSPGSLRPQEAQ